MRDPDLIPHAVVELLCEDWKPTQAWRTYLGLSAAQVAKQLGMSEAAYGKLEAAPALDEKTRERVAAALGIHPGQLDF